MIVRKLEKRSGPTRLGEPRLELINRWLPPPEAEAADEVAAVEELETAEETLAPAEDQNVVPISRHQGDAVDVYERAIETRPEPAVEPRPAVFREAPAEPGFEAADAPRRRGRPRRHVKRRQVHFHVDPDEDTLLLAAARQHGSQQKGLIAALRALQEVARLRDEVERLKRHSEHQQHLLAAARSLLDKP